MNAEIITYDEKYLEQHVSLGKQLTEDWKYFGQTNLDIMRQQYSKSHFDPSTRFYVIDNDTLVGFQTSQIHPDEQSLARMEFPIIKEKYSDIIPKLMEHTETVLKQKSVDRIRARASKFWGDTVHHANNYGFEPVEDLYYVTQFKLNEMQSTGHIDYDPVDYHPSSHEYRVKSILMKWLDTSESLAEAYTRAMKSPSPSTLAHLIVSEGNNICGRLAVSKFEKEEQIHSTGSLFVDSTHDDADRIFESLFNTLIIEGKKASITNSTLYITGGDYSNFKVDKYGLELEPVITFYEKELM